MAILISTSLSVVSSSNKEQQLPTLQMPVLRADNDSSLPTSNIQVDLIKNNVLQLYIQENYRNPTHAETNENIQLNNDQSQKSNGDDHLILTEPVVLTISDPGTISISGTIGDTKIVNISESLGDTGTISVPGAVISDIEAISISGTVGDIGAVSDTKVETINKPPHVSHPTNVECLKKQLAVYKADIDVPYTSVVWQYADKGTRWVFRNLSDRDGMTGTQSNTLKVPSSHPKAPGGQRGGLMFRAVFTLPGGSKMETEVAMLIIVDKPKIHQPGNVSIHEGEVAEFKADINIPYTSIQWRSASHVVGEELIFQDVTDSDGIKDFKSTTLKVPGTIARNGSKFYAVFYDNGIEVAKTDPATLQVTLNIIPEAEVEQDEVYEDMVVKLMVA